MEYIYRTYVLPTKEDFQRVRTHLFVEMPNDCCDSDKIYFHGNWGSCHRFDWAECYKIEILRHCSNPIKVASIIEEHGGENYPQEFIPAKFEAEKEMWGRDSMPLVKALEALNEQIKVENNIEREIRFLIKAIDPVLVITPYRDYTYYLDPDEYEYNHDYFGVDNCYREQAIETLEGIKEFLRSGFISAIPSRSLGMCDIKQKIENHMSLVESRLGKGTKFDIKVAYGIHEKDHIRNLCKEAYESMSDFDIPKCGILFSYVGYVIASLESLPNRKFPGRKISFMGKFRWGNVRSRVINNNLHLLETARKARTDILDFIKMHPDCFIAAYAGVMSEYTHVWHEW